MSSNRPPQMLSRTRLQNVLREAAVIAFLLTGILAARSTLADHYYVPSGSMENTLQVGDRVVVDKRAFGLRVPFTRIRLTRGDRVRRGDIVIFDSPRDGTRLIKRIVAVGGDRVALQDGRLIVNGALLAGDGIGNIEMIGDRRVVLNLRDGGGPEYAGILDKGTVLAIGDHRGNSVDSRMFGAIDEAEVYGRALAVYFRRGDGFVWQRL